MPMMGLDVPKEEIDKIFDEWDADKSGIIAIAELNDMLRKRIELDPKLMPGAAGEIELNRDQNIALRKDKINKDDSSLLQGLDIDESKPIADQAPRPLHCTWRRSSASLPLAPPHRLASALAST